MLLASLDRQVARRSHLGAKECHRSFLDVLSLMCMGDNWSHALPSHGATAAVSGGRTYRGTFWLYYSQVLSNLTGRQHGRVHGASL